MERHNLTKFIIFIINLYFITLGLGWIFLHLYLRLLIKRNSITLDELKPLITYIHWSIYLYIAILHIFILIVTIRYLLQKTIKETSIFYKFSTYVYKIINEIYWKPLEYIVKITGSRLLGSRELFIGIVHQSAKYSDHENKYIMEFISAIFNWIPKLIVASAFFIDIIIFNQVKYFIYVVNLLIIPIILEVFIIYYIAYATRNIRNVSAIFDKIEGIGEPYVDYLLWTEYESYYFELQDHYDFNDREEYIYDYYMIVSLQYIGTAFKHLNSERSTYVTIITSSLYLIASIYRIFYLLF